jgi:hypothetical protein
VQDIATEEPQRADLRDHRPHGKPSFFEEKQVVASELRRGNPIEARTRVLAKRVYDLDVAANGGGGIVATHHLVAQTLQ